MTKNEFIWILIRFSGVLFLFQAVILIPGMVVSSSWLLFNGGDFSATTGAGLAAMTAQHQLATNLFKLIFFSAIGIYLLKKGKWLFNIISKPT